MHLKHRFFKYIHHLEGNEGVGEGRMAQWSVTTTCRAQGYTVHDWTGSTPGDGSVIRKSGYSSPTPKATINKSREQIPTRVLSYTAQLRECLKHSQARAAQGRRLMCLSSPIKPASSDAVKAQARVTVLKGVTSKCDPAGITCFLIRVAQESPGNTSQASVDTETPVQALKTHLILYVPLD